MTTTLRPKDLALLLLASGDLSPRQRARDQQADLAGSALKTRLLNALVVLDPEPEHLEATLEQLIASCGPPPGPTRAIAMGVLEEWHVACTSPAFAEWLLAQAIHEGSEATKGRRRGWKDRQTAAAPDFGAA